MRQNPQIASIVLALVLCSVGGSAAFAAPRPDSWQQRPETGEHDRRPDRERGQRTDTSGQRRHVEGREQQYRPQAAQQPQTRQQEDRPQVDMRIRQNEQQAARERMARDQAAQRENQRQQPAARERNQRREAVQNERNRSHDADDRRRWQQANVEREAPQRVSPRQDLQYPQYRDGRGNDRSGHKVSQRDNHRSTEYRRPYRPVYNDRPWYGYHGRGKHPHQRGPVVIYRNVTHVVMIPQPVYVQPVAGYYYDDYYYSGPYAGYDSVYGYDDGGYGYRHSACNSDTVGAAIGAVLGGVIGAHQDRGAGPVVGGALIGAVLGGLLGHAIDESNRACVSDVLEYVPSNRPVYWEDGGYGYEVTPMRTYEPEPGRYCREYQTVVTVGGRAEQAYGTACRQPDGSWQIVS
jgi:surface antigen